MSVIRIRKQSHFVAVSNTTARNEALSLQAKGLLIVMLSFPDDWEFNLNHIEGQSHNKRDAHRTALKELIAAGYARWQSSQDESGKLTGRELLVSDEPSLDRGTENPSHGATVGRENRRTEKPSDGKSDTTKNEGYEEGDDEPPSPPTNGQANEPNGHADEDTFNPKALRKLQESDLETFKRVEQRANALKWQFRHKTLAAMRALRDPPGTLAAMDATIEGADATGAKAYRYFKTVLTGGPKPNGQTKEPDQDQARAMRRNIGRLGRHPTLGEIRPTSVALNLEHYNVGNGPPAKPEDIQWLE